LIGRQNSLLPWAGAKGASQESEDGSDGYKGNPIVAIVTGLKLTALWLHDRITLSRGSSRAVIERCTR
jgi:hypothetical protein